MGMQNTEDFAFRGESLDTGKVGQTWPIKLTEPCEFSVGAGRSGVEIKKKKTCSPYLFLVKPLALYDVLCNIKIWTLLVIGTFGMF